MTKIQQIIGERIRNFRKQKGWSQEELADIANLHATYIGQLERGEKNATLESINKIATALEVSLEELFKSIQPNSKNQIILCRKLLQNFRQGRLKIKNSY